MSKKKNQKLPMTTSNRNFFDSLALNDSTFMDYRNRFRKLALSMFEWVNLPDTMDARYLELSLYLYGQCALFKDKEYGFINTNCNASSPVNIYGLPTKLNCYSFDFQRDKLLYTGLKNTTGDPDLQEKIDNQAILVMNDWNRIPTCITLDLFAYRLYEVERSLDVNIKTSKFPLLIRTSEKQKHSMLQFYTKFTGNEPIIVADKNSFDDSDISVIRTDVKLITDDLTSYKKQIWNEALTFLGINNIVDEKKERLISNEADSNNELINLNLQSYLAPRQLACKQFNECYNPEKEISVRVRSDLNNTIKQMMSVVSQYQNLNKEDKNYGNLYNETE